MSGDFQLVKNIRTEYNVVFYVKTDLENELNYLRSTSTGSETRYAMLEKRIIELKAEMLHYDSLINKIMGL